LRSKNRIRKKELPNFFRRMFASLKKE